MPTKQEEAYISVVEKTTKKPPDLPEADNNKLFFQQRNLQRKGLFWFSIIISSFSILFLTGLIVVQGILRCYIDKDFEIISDAGLQIIAVAIFGQIFGVIYIIAKALWSNDEFDLIKNGKK